MEMYNCEWWLYFLYYSVYMILLFLFIIYNKEALFNIYLAFSEKKPKTVFFFLFLLIFPLLGDVFVKK